MGTQSTPNVDQTVTRGPASTQRPIFANEAATIAPVVTTTPTTSAYGFTLPQAQAIIANQNAILAALKANGIVAES